MSAAQSARSVSHTEGVDKVRALQRVLYRSAKHDRSRRFHALYDKVARSDVLWRAWVEVARIQGALVLMACRRRAQKAGAQALTGESRRRPTGPAANKLPFTAGLLLTM